MKLNSIKKADCDAFIFSDKGKVGHYTKHIKGADKGTSCGLAG